MSDPILSREEVQEIERKCDITFFVPDDSETFPGTYINLRQLRDYAARIEAAVLEKVCGEPVGWRHVMHMEGGQTQTRLTEDAEDHFGVPGEDYSEEYVVTSEPLFALTRSKP
ncbi:hypothetical protein ABXK61_16290 [Burkholderia sola]|uniref:hypothetical protein n=1 Tax=Burkholderia TaxID=32008 RepID=UPI001AE4590E|nr:hypothetical protein [Burkholderia sp. AcTa6-5]MBP0714865.1 hypothetical protein [Burkholderia sp. AcTa6-5]